MFFKNNFDYFFGFIWFLINNSYVCKVYQTRVDQCWSGDYEKDAIVIVNEKLSIAP